MRSTLACASAAAALLPVAEPRKATRRGAGCSSSGRWPWRSWRTASALPPSGVVVVDLEHAPALALEHGDEAGRALLRREQARAGLDAQRRQAERAAARDHEHPAEAERDVAEAGASEPGAVGREPHRRARIQHADRHEREPEAERGQQQVGREQRAGERAERVPREQPAGDLARRRARAPRARRARASRAARRAAASSAGPAGRRGEPERGEAVRGPRALAAEEGEAARRRDEHGGERREAERGDDERAAERLLGRHGARALERRHEQRAEREREQRHQPDRAEREGGLVQHAREGLRQQHLRREGAEAREPRERRRLSAGAAVRAGVRRVASLRPRVRLASASGSARLASSAPAPASARHATPTACPPLTPMRSGSTKLASAEPERGAERVHAVEQRAAAAERGGRAERRARERGVGRAEAGGRGQRRGERDPGAQRGERAGEPRSAS